MATPPSNGSRNASGGAAGWSKQQQRLEQRFPVHSSWEMTLTSKETVTGRIYCTDEVSQTVVLQSALTHTTLATEMRIINASAIVRAVAQKKKEEDGVVPLSVQLPKVQKKALEERERRAIRMAEESLRHINQKVG
jgi:hypothetical protein